MPCARCSTTVTSESDWYGGKEYEYCADCVDLFNEVRESGVVVRSRHGNRDFESTPYEVGVKGDIEETPVDLYEQHGQTGSLAQAKAVMDANDIRGLFIYQKTGSTWLIEEYLNAHPKIAEDVEETKEELERQEKSLISRLPFLS